MSIFYFTPSLRASGDAHHEVNAEETQCEVSGEMGEEKKQQLGLNEIYLCSFNICHYQSSLKMWITYHLSLITDYAFSNICN